MAKKLIKKATKGNTKSGRIITVKNADGDADTKATILIQNKIKYTPRVSVIIPVYNVEKYLRECLDSVVNQTLREIEIICVDDGSTDSSLDILKEYAARDNRITVITQENLHAGVARNAGLAVAKGEYLSFLDSDDFFELNMLEEMYNKGIKDKSDTVVCGYCIYNNEKQITTSNVLIEDKFVSLSPFSPKDISGDAFTFCNPNPWSKIFKREIFTKNSIAFEKLLRCNDFTCVYTCMSISKKISIVNEIFIHYRSSQENNLSSKRNNHIDCFFNAISKLEKNLQFFNLYDIFENTFENRVKNSLNYELSGCSEEQKRNVRMIANDILSQNLYFKLYAPKVSVLMTAYNSGAFIAEAIESILNQTYPYFEFIIINDGSTDNTPEIIQEYAAKDKRIRFVNNNKNQGLIAVLNQGLDLCEGEYIARMDSDDISYPDRFEKQIKYLDANPDVGILSCWFEYFPEKKDSTIGHHKEFIRFEDILKGWCINHGMSMFRRSVFVEHKLKYNPEFKAAEDYELWSQAIKYTKIRNLQETLYKYRKYGGSICDTQREIQNKNSEIVKRNMLLYLKKNIRDKNLKTYINGLLSSKDYKYRVIPVVVSSDDKYSKTLAVCLYSILKKTSAFIDFIILSDGIQNKNIKKIKDSIKHFKNYKISFIDMKKFNLQQFPVIDRFDVSVFSRYFIPEICKDYDKVIYTDADVVFNGDIEEYFNINLEGKGIAATPEEYGSPRPGKYSHEIRKQVFGIDNSHLYFANGNLIISCDYWRKHNITEKLIQKTKELSNQLICPDLDVMNVVFQNNYKKLHFKYCTTVHRYDCTQGNKEMLDAYKNPFIIHYSGGLKPWITNQVLFFDEWYNIYKKTKYNEPVVKPYLLFPYYLLATMWMKWIYIPVLKFIKHMRAIWYSHSHRGKMDMLNNNFRKIITTVQSVQTSMQKQIDSIKNQQNDLTKQVNNNISGVKQNTDKQISVLSDKYATMLDKITQQSDNIKGVEDSILNINNQISETQELFESNVSDVYEKFDKMSDKFATDLTYLEKIFKSDVNKLSEITDAQNSVLQNQISGNFKVISEHLNDSEKLLSEQINTNTNLIDTKFKQLSEHVNKNAELIDTKSKDLYEKLNQNAKLYTVLDANVSEINAQQSENKKSIVDIQNGLYELDKETKALFKQNSEPYWANVYHDTINDSDWLTNKSVSPGRWAVSYIVLYVLYRILDEIKPQSILECGLGQSSKLTIQYADNHDADLMICENNPDWLSFFQRQFPTANKHTKILDTEMVHIVPEYESRTYAGFKSAIRGKKFDMVLIDGPLGSEHYSRPEILDVVDNLDKSFVILLDDMNRVGEQEIWKMLKQKLTDKGIRFVDTVYSSDKSVGLLCSPDLKWLKTL